jgi:flagellar biosynthetic protein FliR
VTVSAATLIALVLASSRVLAWLAVSPPFATMGLPPSVRPILAVALALAVTPVAAAHPVSLETGALIQAAALNVGVGAALGFSTRLIFSAVEAAGSLIDVSGGFSLAFALDPMSNSNNSVFGRFYGLFASTLLFATQAHLLVIMGFLRSFRSVPLDGGISLATLDLGLIDGVTEMFVSALQIAGPMLVVLFLADLALGLLNRIAPQMNVFSLSFPLKIALTLGLVGLGFVMMPQTIDHLANEAVSIMGRLYA